MVGLGESALVSFFLPFTGGDQVLVAPSGASGEIRGWTVTGRRLGVEMVYRVHLVGTPYRMALPVQYESWCRPDCPAASSVPRGTGRCRAWPDEIFFGHSRPAHCCSA